MTQLESTHHISEMDNFLDTRVAKWPLMSSPSPIILMMLVYLYVIYFGGPQFMKNRKPYSLKTYMRFYNLFQVIANFLLVFTIVTNGRPFVPVWRYCEPFDKIYGNATEKQFEVIWWALCIKIIDLSETVTFMLRKKDHQISFLHLYHHISTVFYAWLTIRYFTHGHLITSLVLNSSVHVIMYSYYFLSTFGSDIQRRLLPFKKWVTVIQMTHLTFLAACSLQGIIPNCGNNIVKYYSMLTLFNLTVNLSFFINFYGSYKKQKKTA